MPKGRLTKVEKHAIDSMLSKKMDSSAIAEELGRGERVVKNYMKENPPSPQKPAEEKPVIVVAHSNVIKVVVGRLRLAGLTDNDIEKIMEKTLARAETKNKSYVGAKAADKLYTDCIRSIKSHQLMIKKSAGGRDGVAIMTPGAAARGDDFSKSVRGQHTSRSSKGNVYDIKNDRMF